MPKRSSDFPRVILLSDKARRKEKKEILHSLLLVQCAGSLLVESGSLLVESTSGTQLNHAKITLSI